MYMKISESATASANAVPAFCSSRDWPVRLAV
jgi:hypothetical protein